MSLLTLTNLCQLMSSTKSAWIQTKLTVQGVSWTSKTTDISIVPREITMFGNLQILHRYITHITEKQLRIMFESNVKDCFPNATHCRGDTVYRENFAPVLFFALFTLFPGDKF